MIFYEDRVLTNPSEIAECTMKYLKSLFSSNYVIFQDLKIVDETIPSIVDDNMNHIITTFP